ncbi:MAG: acetyl-CoA hydrolase/transferase family protein [Deltaproteobacteria bacterium]|nr:MAG: acetyl-CoA hydrolase/transferase family protein [Deltaproteobacteria bacterium]
MPEICSAHDAVARIPDGGFVYIAGNAATPKALVRALGERRDLTEGIGLGHVLLLDELGTLDPNDHLRHRAWFVGPGDRAAVNDGRADYVPVHLHQIPDVIAKGPPPDAALISASPPDAHGWMSLGVEVLASRAAIRHAKQVIVQVNEAMPRVHGDAFIHVDDVDLIVNHTEALPEVAPSAPTETECAIAGHITPLISDGATLQLGIGGIPNAVLALLQGRHELGLHTEMVMDGLIQAIDAGVITGRRKTLHPGKAIVTFAMGTRALYDFIDDNPLIEAHPVEHVNHPKIIAKNDKMVAINSALCCDLTGQVVSDSIGRRVYSGFGGQVDFLRGAAWSEGGVPIVAFPSTAKGGSVSRIVPVLAPGAGVVTSRADVHWVVTEYGAVNLFGRSIRERARLLTSIAHPDHRAELEEEAARRGWR